MKYKNSPLQSTNFQFTKKLQIKISHFSVLYQSHDPSFQPSRHRSFTNRQSKRGLPNLLFTLLCIRHSHCDSEFCDEASTGSFFNL